MYGVVLEGKTYLVVNSTRLIYTLGVLLEREMLNQGPVVQSIVSLTSSLRGQLVKCFTTL